MLKLFKNLTFQVLIAIVAGILLGVTMPEVAKSTKPLGEIFINMIKMVITPIIFFTIVLGVGNMRDMKKLGRVGAKTLIYFEIVTTLALFIGIMVAYFVKPGLGISVSNLRVDPKITEVAAKAHEFSWTEFFIHIVPDNIVNAFSKGDILQVLFFAVLFGVALSSLGEKTHSLLITFDKIQTVLFKILSVIMRLAPLGAFSGMAYTIGSAGLPVLFSLGKLMLCVYITMALFVFVVLNLICWMCKVSLWKFLRFIKEELLIVLGTSSSESVLPQMIERMQKFGCSKSIVGLVIPTGYSFNLDGTNIYLSIAIVFLAQAFGVELTLAQMASVFLVLMLTSKGAAAVTGGGFVVLASTLSVVHVVPVEGLVLLLGVDRLMSEARAITNLIGNGVATIVVSKSEGEFQQPVI